MKCAPKSHISNIYIPKLQNFSLLYFVFFKDIFLRMSAKSSTFAPDFERHVLWSKK